MKILLFLAIVVYSIPTVASLSASQPVDVGELPEPQSSHGIELPVWEIGSCRENFDIRIWPEATIAWLEQENLKRLIADPSLPEEERASLKQILALQQAWRNS